MAASEARALGYGGVSRIHRACGLSRKAIAKGMREIAEGTPMPGGFADPAQAGSTSLSGIPPCSRVWKRLIDRTRGRSRIPLTLDLQEHADARGATDGAAAPGQS